MESSSDGDDDDIRWLEVEPDGDVDGEMEQFFEERFQESFVSMLGALSLSIALLICGFNSAGFWLPGFHAQHARSHHSSSASCLDETTCRLPSCFNSSNFDALVVCGGGQTPTGPPQHVVLRLDKALEM